MKEWLRSIWSRAWAVVRKERLDREFDEELSTHLELLVDEGRRRGLSHADAQREALRKLGRPAALRELHREQRGMPVLDVLAQDLRYSIRILSKSPAFACMATLSLALGIGANTALFSLVDGLLLRSLPVREPDRLVQVQQRLTGSAKKPIDSFPKPVFDHVRTHNQVFSDIVGFNVLDRPVVTIDGEMEPSRQVDQVSDNFFLDLGVTPVVGRMPERSDGAVVILSYHLWRDRFSGSASVLGRLLIIDGQACPPPRRGPRLKCSSISSLSPNPRSCRTSRRRSSSYRPARGSLNCVRSMSGRCWPSPYWSRSCFLSRARTWATYSWCEMRRGGVSSRCARRSVHAGHD